MALSPRAFEDPSKALHLTRTDLQAGALQIVGMQDSAGQDPRQELRHARRRLGDTTRAFVLRDPGLMGERESDSVQAREQASSFVGVNLE